MDIDRDDDPLDWIALALLPGLGPRGVATLTEHGLRPAEILCSSARAIGVRGKAARSWDRRRNGARRLAERERRRAAAAGVRVVGRGCPDYPPLLARIHDPPLALWVRGELPPETLRVAVVGSRTPTAYGRRVAASLAERLAEIGAEVVSGGARGIDGGAHRAALDRRGRTTAVLGSGLLRPYPAEHAPLFDRIAGSGAVVSEFPLDLGPSAGHFPRRNRVISGLCPVTVVVEAALRSGSLSTASHALDQGREVLAVPGPITSAKSAGCHRLIRDGAAIVESVEDVLRALPGAEEILKTLESVTYEPPRLDDLSGDERAVLGILDEVEPFHVDRIAERVAFGVARLQAALMGLEFRGAVEQPTPGYYLSRPRGHD